MPTNDIGADELKVGFSHTGEEKEDGPLPFPVVEIDDAWKREAKFGFLRAASSSRTDLSWRRGEIGARKKALFLRQT